jgi:hypothetical protein
MPRAPLQSHEIGHYTGFADLLTLMYICRNAFTPLLPVLENASTTNCTLSPNPAVCSFAQYYIQTAYLPAANVLLQAGAAYSSKHGVLLS